MQAITHAVDEWRVDIINMSFSLEREPAIVERAIGHAASKRVLMFAAASNNKFNREVPIGFPACLGDRVICINAHGGSNSPCEFSPSPEQGRANFALPGQGIPVTLPGGTVDVVQGTSCATPIAAGIAALVLDFNTYIRADAEGGLMKGKR